MQSIVAWHLISPNGKEEILDEGGRVIADPFCVLRGIIRAKQTYILDFNAVGYIEVAPTDVGLPVTDPLGGAGVLDDYDNTARTWTIITITGAFTVGQIATIVGGVGTGAINIIEVDDGTFNAYSPAISGRVEKVIIIPDHAEPPGIGGTFDIEAFQHYVEAPLINVGDVPVQEALDILDGQGLAVVDNAITHLTKFDAPPYAAPVRTGILPHILIQDKLKFAFQRWADAEDYDYKSIYIDLYLTK